MLSVTKPLSSPLSAGAGSPLPVRKSLRTKGFVATMALLVYVVVAGVYLSAERNEVYKIIETLQQFARHEKALALTEAAVNGAVIDVSQASNAGNPEPGSLAEISLYMESCAKLFMALGEFDARYALTERTITRSYEVLRSAPERANWIDLREALHRASDDLEIRHRNLVERREELTVAYQHHFDAVTVKSLLLSLAGIAIFGALVAWFFARLTGDIRMLELHARAIVSGRRGVHLPVVREDELGQLMLAVNQMDSDLDQREKQIELVEAQRAHQSKMVALGALAAGVAHEINNPLAVIAGLAQELGSTDTVPSAENVNETAKQILSLTQRAGLAARTLADLAAPQPTEFDWVDVNAMVRRAVQLMGYDKRYRHIDFRADLAPDVPAVRAPGATMQQVITQILSLGCDAMPVARDGQTYACVTTRDGVGWVNVLLEFPVHLDLAQPQNQRVLTQSRAFVEPLSVRLDFDQGAGPMLCVKLAWPVDTGGA